MLRKVGLISALLLATPALASAWTVTAKIGSGQGTVVSGTKTLAKPGTYVGYYRAENGVVADQTFTVDPAVGFSIASVIVNGAAVTPSLDAEGTGTVTVGAGAPIKNSQSMVVYFKQNLSGVTATQSTGGRVTVQRCNADGSETYGSISLSSIANLKPGSYVKVTAMPNADYKVASIDGTDVVGALQGEIKSQVLQIGSAVEAVDAVFTQVASVTPAISVYPAIVNPGGVVTVNAGGTKTNATGSTVSYAFATSAPGVTFTPVAGKPYEATGSFPAEGNFTITVTASVDGASNEISWPVEVKHNNACLTCHTTATRSWSPDGERAPTAPPPAPARAATTASTARCARTSSRATAHRP